MTPETIAPDLCAGRGLSVPRHRALAVTDGLAPELRECVHEFGLPIVTICLKFGVNSPRKIRELVKEIWAGARQTAQSGNIRETLDWLLMQSGCNVSAKTLHRLLAENNMVIASAEPTREMLDASMAEVSGHDIRCTKEEKHKRRLRAALRAAMQVSLKNKS